GLDADSGQRRRRLVIDRDAGVGCRQRRGNVLHRARAADAETGQMRLGAEHVTAVFWACAGRALAPASAVTTTSHFAARSRRDIHTLRGKPYHYAEPSSNHADRDPPVRESASSAGEFRPGEVHTARYPTKVVLQARQ